MNGKIKLEEYPTHLLDGIFQARLVSLKVKDYIIRTKIKEIIKERERIRGCGCPSGAVGRRGETGFQGVIDPIRRFPDPVPRLSINTIKMKRTKQKIDCKLTPKQTKKQKLIN
jgi:hypothetical protein